MARIILDRIKYNRFAVVEYDEVLVILFCEVDNKMHSSNNILIIKEAIEKVLYEIGFNKVTIKLATKTDKGQEELECYNHNEMYCLVSITKHTTTSGILKDLVLIEYASSLSEASKWMFEDGDMIPLDLPIKQIIDELKVEVLNAISLAK